MIDVEDCNESLQQWSLRPQKFAPIEVEAHKPHSLPRSQEVESLHMIAETETEEIQRPRKDSFTAENEPESPVVVVLEETRFPGTAVKRDGMTPYIGPLEIRQIADHWPTHTTVCEERTGGVRNDILSRKSPRRHSIANLHDKERQLRIEHAADIRPSFWNAELPVSPRTEICQLVGAPNMADFVGAKGILLTAEPTIVLEMKRLWLSLPKSKIGNGGDGRVDSDG